MCNAWNHPAGCNCGWGGVWYARGVTSPAALRVSLESFVNPHARCPVCGAGVFYYQSPDGGRVFFDALGPPWPKHPCTDNAPSSRLSRPRPSPSLPRYQWQQDAWVPFILSSVLSYSPRLVRVSGHCGDAPLELYIRKQSLPPSRDPREFMELAAVLVKLERPGRYRMSVLGPSLTPTELFGYASSLEADNPLTPARPRGPLHRVKRSGRRA